MLRRFLKAYTVELRLLVLHWSYPLLHVALLGMLLTLDRRWSEARTALGILETMHGHLAIGLISLLGLFAAGLGASRAERNKAAELEWTFPTGVELTIARWLAGMTALIGFAVGPLIVAWRHGPPSSFMAGMSTYVGETALTLAFTTAGGWWLARRVPLGRWSYPLLAAGWLGFLLGPTMLIGRVPYPSLLNFMRKGTMSYHSELFRRIAYGDAFCWFNLFYVGLGLVFIGLLARHEARGRFRRPSFAASSVALGGLALALIAGVNYVTPIAALATGAPADPSPPVVNIEGLRAERYVVTLDLHDSKHPEFQVALTVRNDGNEPARQVVLELHPTLAVLSSDVTYRQEKATVVLELPEALKAGESHSVSLQYAGPIWETYLEDGLAVAEVFVHPRGVRLSPLVAWYPRLDDATTSSSAIPFEFHLTVHGNDRLNFASNIPAVGPNTFASRDATWIFVVGSPFLVTEQVGDITLITARDILPQVRTMITIYADALSVLRRFMPDVPVEGLTAMVLDPQWLPVGTPPSDGRVVIVIGPLVLHNVTRVDAYDFPMVWDAVLGDLLQLGGSSTAGALPWYARGTAVFIWMYHHCDADAACIADEMSTRGWSSQNGVEIPPALLDLYERGGEDAIAEVLREFRLRPQEFDAMSPEEIFGWLREVTDAQ